MNMQVSQTEAFPSAHLSWGLDQLPVEVVLLAQLDVGAGDRLIADAADRQARHSGYIDALDEPSARLAVMHPDLDDPSSLYTFKVGRRGHPFHRHAGHRVFTAIAGSGGVQLRFARADDAACLADPDIFIRALKFVDVPPDALFLVRFGGETWHQFVPLGPTAHPALFAISCHTNEWGGRLSPQQRQAVRQNQADIATLTEVLPDHLSRAWRAAQADLRAVPRIKLAFSEAETQQIGRLDEAKANLGRTQRRRGNRR